MRIVAPALILAALAIGGQQAFPAQQPQSSAVVAEAQPVKIITLEDAESQTDRKMWAVMGDDASGCWEKPEHRFNRTPVSAVVKADGSMGVRRVAVTEIKKNEWVLAWCEAPKETR